MKISNVRLSRILERRQLNLDFFISSKRFEWSPDQIREIERLKRLERYELFVSHYCPLPI